MMVNMSRLASLSAFPPYSRSSKHPTINQSKTIQRIVTETGPLIPRKIWQIYFNAKEAVLGDTPSWLVKNVDYTYSLVGLDGGNRYVNQHYTHNQELLQTYHAITNTGAKSDLLRYLILSVEGGTYTDTDTVAIKPIDDWVPPHLRHLVRIIVGIEYDALGAPPREDMQRELQFCQWTISAAPGHPIFMQMADRAIKSLHEIANAHDTKIEDLHPTGVEVVNSTGPVGWTDVVFQYLQEVDSGIVRLGNLSGITEPTLYGDMLVLPIDGFGMGQTHSNSTHDGSIPEAALLQHRFRGSWRGEGD
ncbi:alpha-1,6-mannosyltransferase Och1 [Hypoxylon sp. NC1633]|nr:alpha-1,6-mannosyltransferase Och1 [Hypoxylon sp. NC1633]